MLCVYVCRAHHLPTNVVHFVCRDRFYCVTMRRGCAATRDPARVVSQQEDEKSGEYLLQRFYHANMDRYCVLALCCVSWCCVCGVRCKVVMKLLIHMKNTNNKK